MDFANLDPGNLPGCSLQCARKFSMYNKFYSFVIDPLLLFGIIFILPQLKKGLLYCRKLEKNIKRLKAKTMNQNALKLCFWYVFACIFI